MILFLIFLLHFKVSRKNVLFILCEKKKRNSGKFKNPQDFPHVQKLSVIIKRQHKTHSLIDDEGSSHSLYIFAIEMTN